VNAPAPNLTNATGADQIAIIGFAITNITFSNSVRLGAGAFTVKEKLALSVLSVAFFAVTVYTVYTTSWFEY
jgi:hypothetical protein